MAKRHIGIVIVACAAVAGCNQNRPAKAEAAAPAPVAVANAAPAPSSAPGTYQASGPLIVEQQVDVAAQREGVVARIWADVGTRVRRGQLLAQLDDRQLTADRDAAQAKALGMEADYEHWKADLKMRESDLSRSEEMFKASLITAKQLDHDRYAAESGKFFLLRQEHDLQNARAELRAAELELGKTRIVAPFNGVVARRYVREGQKIAANDRLFWVTATAPLNVKFTLPQEFAGKIKVGDKVQVAAPAAGTGTHEAKITLVSPVVDPASGTIELQAQVLGTPGELRPGMTVSINVKAP